MDNSSFLNWTYTRNESDTQKAIVFQSLVATLKSQDALDDSLEAKADTFLKSVKPDGKESAEAFLHSFGGTTADSLTDFVQSIGVLISSPYQNITRATMKMLTTLQSNCSFQIRLSLVKADLIPQLISTLNPQSISFAGTLDIHNNLIYLINNFNWIAAPYGLASLEITDENGQQVVHETVFQQVLAPSEHKPSNCFLPPFHYTVLRREGRGTDGHNDRLFRSKCLVIDVLSSFHALLHEISRLAPTDPHVHKLTLAFCDRRLTKCPSSAQNLNQGLSMPQLELKET
ncbi:hypothetical protein BLNAU_16858 [Blattamonas nauphoetae]|uniref:Uncharacterized protein n=1 Tax=Blattamonas nauphoetae TaxID=2049346 RepID=A0ABQ9XA08_9EUKA|nr:hypothetical protein BLNAU_16858 [Blattamonas nauphoetae]